MTARSPSAFMLSATLHAVFVGLAMLLSYTASRQNEPNAAKVFELVAGEGDNYMATEAPALGTPGGVKLDFRAPPEPKVEPRPTPPPAEREPEPQPVEPAPVQPAPAPVAKPVETKIPNFSSKLKRDLIVAESRTKQQIQKMRAAEARKAAAEKKAAEKKAEEESKRMSKAEFDRLHKGKAPSSTTTKVASAKIPKIDAEGIAKGVKGGSPRNKTGGAGGKALVASDGTVLERYYAMFKERVKRTFEQPPGLADTLVAVVSVTSNANGSLTNARIIDSSGSKEFDDAVLDAVRRTTMPPRPDGKTETIQFPFTMRERDDF